jgi:hypothetical protein
VRRSQIRRGSYVVVIGFCFWILNLSSDFAEYFPMKPLIPTIFHTMISFECFWILFLWLNLSPWNLILFLLIISIVYIGREIVVLETYNKKLCCAKLAKVIKRRQNDMAARKRDMLIWLELR